MEYEGTKSVVCDAEESDWLDISYSAKYIEAEPRKVRRKSKITHIGKVGKVAIVAVLCVAILAVMLLADGNFKEDVFSAVRTAVTSIFGSGDKTEANTINIPCNLTLIDVNDGIMTFGGGRAAVSLTGGTVIEISETGLTVSVDEDTTVSYDGLTSVLVAVGESVSENSLLGKYDGQYTASILQNGEVVKEVVGSETQLTWNV